MTVWQYVLGINLLNSHSDIKLNIQSNLVLQPLKKIVSLNEQTYRKMFSGTPVRRLGYNRFLRNILIAIGNSGDSSLIDLYC